MVQAGEDGAGHGERVEEELAGEVEQCQHWIEVEEAALTKRWKLIGLIPFFIVRVRVDNKLLEIPLRSKPPKLLNSKPFLL